MKKFIFVLLALTMILCMTLPVMAADEEDVNGYIDNEIYAYTTDTSSEITADVTFNDNIATISGTVNGVGGSTEVTILVGEPDNIIYINQKTLNSDGRFSFDVLFNESIPSGQYTYKIGSDANVGTYTGTINYNGHTSHVTSRFMTADLTLSIDGFVPSISGTVSCTKGKIVNITANNVTNNTVIADETVTSDDGIFDISYILPSLVSAKEYTVAVTVSDGTEQQVVMNVDVDSSIVLVKVDGTINVEDGTWIDVQAESVGSNIINKSTTVTSDRNIAITIPNLVANANIRLLAKAYETLTIEEDDLEFDIAIDANADSSSISVIGNIYPSFETDMRAEIIDSDSCVMGTADFKSDTDGSYSYTFDLSGKLKTGLYKIVVYVLNSEKTIEMPVIIPLEKVNVIEEDNPALYRALVNARDELDPERDGVINVSELEAITGILDLGNSNIESIDGLQSCTGITDLYINDNKIENMDAIASLDNLTKLVADKNKLKTIVFLPKNLIFLNVAQNNIINLHGVRCAEEIKYLFASNNFISDISFMENTTDLEYVDLSVNRIEDISSISNCTNIIHLDLSTNSISDVNALSGLHNLCDLYISLNNISDITPLPDVWYRNLHARSNYFPYKSILNYNAVNVSYTR